MKILATKSFIDDKYFIFLKNNRDYKIEKEAYLELHKKVLDIVKIVIMINSFVDEDKKLMFPLEFLVLKGTPMLHSYLSFWG